MLSGQLLQLVTSLPIIGLSSDAVESYKSLISCIMTNSHLVDKYIEGLPFTMQILSQKI